MTNQAFAASFSVIIMCGTVHAADTVAYWRFDDGVPTNTAGSLATETNASTLNGTAGKNLSGALPTFDSDRPAPQIYAYLGGPLLSATNSASLRFVNAGLPVDTNSHAG